MADRRRATTTYTTWGRGRKSRRDFLKLFGSTVAASGLGFMGFNLFGTEAENKAATTPAPEPSTTTEKKEKKPDVLLGEFRTDYRYSDSKARRYNLRAVSRAVNGTVVAPGEVFSMNDNISSVDYKRAKVFAEGGETMADGGGLCQVTSTVYMAAHYAGLEIVERNPHYTTLPYIRPGFDATVWFGGQGIPELDMKFKNTTSGKVLVKEWVGEKGFLNAEIRGQEDNGKEVEMHSEQDFRDLDRGIKWSTYKKVTKNGEVIFNGLIHEDLYSFPPSNETEGYNEVRVGGW